MQLYIDKQQNPEFYHRLKESRKELLRALCTLYLRDQDQDQTLLRWINEVNDARLCFDPEELNPQTNRVRIDESPYASIIEPFITHKTLSQACLCDVLSWARLK